MATVPSIPWTADLSWHASGTASSTNLVADEQLTLTDGPIDIPDDSDDVEPTPDSPVPDDEMDSGTFNDEGGSNPTGICGGIGAINLAATLLGICALRRRRVEAE